LEHRKIEEPIIKSKITAHNIPPMGSNNKICSTEEENRNIYQMIY
jgi:hypothetical protein